MIRLGFVPIARNLFRGAQLGIEEKSRQSLALLGHELGFELAYVSPPVSEVEEAQKRAYEARAHGLDFLLVQHVTFALGDVLMPFLDLPLPLGLWAVPDAWTTGVIPQNSLCALNFALSLPTRRQQPAKWFYGHPEDEWFRRRLQVTVHALKGYKCLTNGRLLWIGGPAPGFYRQEDADVPIHVERIPLEALFETMEAIDSADVHDRLKSLDEETAFPRDELLPTLRVELALERLGRGYTAVTLRDWPELQERARTMACAAIARLGDRGYTMTCEGDLAGIASMAAVAAVSGKTAVLLDLAHVTPDGLMAWHCGNAAKEWAAGPTRLIHHFNRHLAAVRDMRLKPGPVCGLRFLENKKAMVYAGRVQDRTDGFDGVSGWIGHLRWARQPLTAYEFIASVLNLRMPHHFVWGREDHEETLIELCHWLGYSVVQPEPELGVVRWPAL